MIFIGHSDNLLNFISLKINLIKLKKNSAEKMIMKFNLIFSLLDSRI